MMRQRIVVACLLLAILASRVWAASDFLYNGVNCGQTSKSWHLVLRASADNTEVAHKAVGHVTAYYWRQGAGSTVITTATLANLTSAYSSGGWIQVDAANQKGLYRLDVPDAAWACGVDWVVLSVNSVYGTATYVNHERVGLASAPDVNVIRWNQTSVAATPVTSNVTQWNGTVVIATKMDANVTFWNGTALIATRASVNVVNTVTAAGTIRKNVAGQTYPVMMVLSSDHVSGATGKTVTITVSKDGAAFAAITGSVAEIASGWYLFSPSAADTNCNTCAYRATAASTDTRNFLFLTAPTP